MSSDLDASDDQSVDEAMTSSKALMDVAIIVGLSGGLLLLLFLLLKVGLAPSSPFLKQCRKNILLQSTHILDWAR